MSDVLSQPRRSLVAQVERHLRAGAPERALGLCEQGLAEWPDFAPFFVLMARALVGCGRQEDAQALAETILESSPGHLLARRIREGQPALPARHAPPPAPVVSAPPPAPVVSAPPPAPVVSAPPPAPAVSTLPPAPVISAPPPAPVVSAPPPAPVLSAPPPAPVVSAPPPAVVISAPARAPVRPAPVDAEEEVDDGGEEAVAGGLVSERLADLYAAQGHLAMAEGMYRAILKRDGPSERVSAKLLSLRGAAPGVDPRVARLRGWMEHFQTQGGR